MFILTVLPASLDPVKDTNADQHDPPAVIATADNAPATSPGITNWFIFAAGSFPPNAPREFSVATTFVHPGRPSCTYIPFWVDIRFKVLAVRIMAVLFAFLLTMQDITKEEFSRYHKKHKLLRS